MTIDAEVARSEADTAYRNARLANFMRAFGSITNPVGCVLETYFSQCALRMKSALQNSFSRFPRARQRATTRLAD